MPPLDIPSFPPANSRFHEVCGSGAYMFAFALAAYLGGTCMIVSIKRNNFQFHPAGLAHFLNPDKVILCETGKQSETLAVTEEALRSGAVRVVVALIDHAMSFTEGRRLQLACGNGRSTGLAIIPENMGNNATETRWRCNHVFETNPLGQDSTLQKWEIIKNKSGTLGTWYVRWDSTAHRLVMVSAAGK